MVSDLPTGDTPGALAAPEIEALCRHTMTWAQQGHEVYWLAPAEIVQVPSIKAVVIPTPMERVPALCRYAIPLHAYDYAGVHVLCTPSELWQRVDMHTRLFTFLCLLQRARPCALFHAWGSVSTAYLTVYTARALTVPAMVSYSAETLKYGHEKAFLREWVARHAAVLVEQPSTRPEPVAASDALMALYQRVCSVIP